MWASKAYPKWKTPVSEFTYLHIKHLSIRNTIFQNLHTCECYDICKLSFIRCINQPTAKPKQGDAHGTTIPTQLGSACIKVYSIKTSGYLTTHTPGRVITINIQCRIKKPQSLKLRGKNHIRNNNNSMPT